MPRRRSRVVALNTLKCPTWLGYRIFKSPRRKGDRPIRSQLQSFEGTIPRASEIDSVVQVRWPKKPGEYELVVDLNLGAALWYEDWNQRPLASAVVRVEPGAETASREEGSP